MERIENLKSIDLFVSQISFFIKFNMKISKCSNKKVSPLQAMKAHGDCGCKGPHIHNHGTRMRLDG